MLARRLDPHLSKLIHNDQNGFVRNRQGFHNIRRVLDILHEKADIKDSVILSLDAQQGFDRIEYILSKQLHQNYPSSCIYIQQILKHWEKRQKNPS